MCHGRIGVLRSYTATGNHLDVLRHRRPDVLQGHEPAHFHAEYQGQQGKFDFEGRLVAGNLQSGTALRLIAEWAGLHRQELESSWEKMKAGRPLEHIRPLE
jgi:hypothetical protein